MIEKQFTPYHIAMELKELGFDEPCVAIYRKENRLYLTQEGVRANSEKESVISAPLWQQVLDWFANEHRLHSGIYPYYDEYSYEIKDFNDNNTPIDPREPVSYYDARMACIKKMIEIVKQD
jgi:hypothetical protein